ncbi:RNA polymerase sigma factor [Pirellulaceae bacterium SH467]|jgi:RNA polymerase sigma-70 factor (ECF subfamily)
MYETPVSLLYRIRSSNGSNDWGRFVELYTPLLFHWAKRIGCQETDAADLVQDVFVILWQKLPHFDYDANQSFHAWLKVIFINRFRSIQRKPIPLTMESGSNLRDHENEMFFLENEEDRRYLYRKALELVECEFSELHREVFRAYVLEQCDPHKIAITMGISVGTVYSIKSKILSRLRQEVRDIL